MDRIDLLIEIEKTIATLRVYREQVIGPALERGSVEDNALQNVLEQLSRDTRGLILMINPSGAPCTRCQGSGKEP
jgi:hypothetical protein